MALLDELLPACISADAIARMMTWYSLSYLPDDIIVKVDRAAMAVGLSARAPFLDHRVAQVACRMPMAIKIRGINSQSALRHILYSYVPRELIERPKAGLAMTIGQSLHAPFVPGPATCSIPIPSARRAIRAPSHSPACGTSISAAFTTTAPNS